VQLVDREHRQHAECELAIRDLKDPALARFPSGRFAANCAWTVIACLGHNLQRWTGQLGLNDPTPRTAQTIRRGLLAIPGPLTRTARRWTLHLPARWPWQGSVIEALTRTRALPAAVSPPPHPLRPAAHVAGRSGLPPSAQQTPAPSPHGPAATHRAAATPNPTLHAPPPASPPQSTAKRWR
jgi:Transposase DDE domain group 1